MIDIHSHILPAVDDGAKTIDESISILNEMLSQGITDVIATPHFYPHNDSLEEFTERREKAFSQLKNLKNSPNIYLGCEILYYSGISKAGPLESFTINNSRYILLELNSYLINKALFSEILYLINERNIIPIIAHIERYHKSRNYKKLLEFVKNNNILTQINATSFFSKRYASTLKKLFSLDLVTFIGTDSHSLEMRPPLMKKALQLIEREYGEERKLKLIENSNKLLAEITQNGENNELNQS